MKLDAALPPVHLKDVAAIARAAEEIGFECELTKVTDIDSIIRYGVLSTPALVIDEKVVCYGGFLPRTRLSNG